MTFCLGIKSADGLLAIADTRITSGTEISRAPKIAVHDIGGYPIFVLTSGLRSLRDKIITYFAGQMSGEADGPARTYEATNTLARQIRRVRTEDSEWLRESGLAFDLHCIVGGRLSEDKRPQMFLVFPEGNWVEVNAATPYAIIGDSRYGKPILDHLWSFEHPIADGLRAGLLAFAETKASASNVDYPLDVVLLRDGSDQIDEIRISKQDGAPIEDEWHKALLVASGKVSPFTNRLFARLAADSPEPASVGMDGD